MEIEELKKLNVDEFHKNYIQKFKNKPFPLFSIIEFNLHGSCSRRCAFCPRVDEKIWPNLDEELNMELFDKILFELEELDYSGRLAFSGFSEPFLHSKLEAIISKIKKKLPKARTEIITNGDFLEHDNTKRLFEVGLDYMFVSLYTNNKTHIYLEDLKKSLGLTDDQFKIRPRNLGRKMNFGLNINNRAGAVDYERFGLKEIKQELPLKRGCNYPMYVIFIDYNGDCLICPDDWQKKAIVGNLQKEKIIDVWTKKLFHEIRKSLLNEDRSHKPCNKCDVNGLISGNEFKTKWQEYYQKKI
jgi:radical SAM protein with 4Fe4S-binding SPASM domain